MIERHVKQRLVEAIDNAPAVALLGPRQVGKTTLALEIGDTRPSLYLDLESNADRAKLADPEAYLANDENELVILDEVHRTPEILQSLRGLIDRGRRKARVGWGALSHPTTFIGLFLSGAIMTQEGWGTKEHPTYTDSEVCFRVTYKRVMIGTSAKPTLGGGLRAAR
jgi:hypothetical protein